MNIDSPLPIFNFIPEINYNSRKKKEKYLQKNI